MMDDNRIVALFWARNEQAITMCNQKFGRTCQAVAMNILNDRLDAEECVNDTWLKAWNSIPPQRPTRLGAFLFKIARNLSLDKLRSRQAERRIPRECMISLDELSECLPDRASGAGGSLSESEIGKAISDFLRTQPAEARNVFICRYFYNESVEALCRRFSMGESKVKSMLFRTRNRLKQYLEKEDIRI